MKKILCFLLVLCMLIPLSACSAKPYREVEETTNYVKLSVDYVNGDGEKCKGDIIVELYPNEAPITVANFQKLVGAGFYDGLLFHRVISEFMIQGGDPNGNGTGGSDEEIKGEFLANGVNNTIKHERGTISMARAGYSYDSASSQFFIVHKTSLNNSYSLDGQYAAFGRVIYGIEHVDGIAGTKTDYYTDKPKSDATIVSATFVEITGELA